MEFVLVILAAVMFTLLGWLLKSSVGATPWVAETAAEADYQAPMGAGPKTIVLVTLLAVITSFFALMVSAYGIRMEAGDWYPVREPDILWTNTALLLLAGIAFQWTRAAARNGRQNRLRPGMVLTGLLTIGFLVGQWLAWQQLTAAGQGLTVNPANGFFFLLTGVHALHIIGGLYVWARATLRVFGGADTAAVEDSIRLCTTYWHFLFIVWLVLFGLMLST